MPKLSMAKASIDSTRELEPRELATIRAALRLWVEIPVRLIPDCVYDEIGDAENIMSDRDIVQLLDELLASRKVHICRSTV